MTVIRQVCAGLFVASLLPLGSEPLGRAGEFRTDNPLNRPAKIYWCPDRKADRQITATADPGCTALYDPERDPKKPDRQGLSGNDESPEKVPLKIVEIQNEASKFSREYREFVECCADDFDQLERIDDLLEQSNYILM